MMHADHDVAPWDWSKLSSFL